MSLRQRSRLVTAVAFLLLIATVANIGRTDGWIEAAKIAGLLVVCWIALLVIIAWERRGKS